MAWMPVDWIDKFGVSQPAGADGLAEVIFDEVPGGYAWRLHTLNVSSTSTADPDALIYIGEALPQFLRAGSNNGNQDTAEGFLLVPAGHYLRVRWVGCSSGAISTVAIQGELLEQIVGQDARPLFGR